MSRPHPRRPHAAIVHAATLAFRSHPHAAAPATQAFAQALETHHHARLPKGWTEGLLLAVFQGAMDRCLGDTRRAVEHIAQDLALVRLFDISKPVLQAA